jgi:ABC-type multidrug transport system ATPase subunit
LCDRAIVLDRGDLIADGPAGEAVKTFRERLLGEAPTLKEEAESHHGAQIESVSTATGRFELRTGAPFSFDVALQAFDSIDGFFVLRSSLAPG